MAVTAKLSESLRQGDGNECAFRTPCDVADSAPDPALTTPTCDVTALPLQKGKKRKKKKENLRQGDDHEYRLGYDV